MKTLKWSLAASVLVVFLAVASPAQQQGAQTLSTTTLSAAIPPAVGSGITSQITLASLTNVTATVSVGTTLWIDTEAMDVVTNSVPASGTTILVQRGSHGTRAQSHASGRTVYVGRPNLFQGYPVAGTCWTDAAQSQLPPILPWIDLTGGSRYDCKSDGNWFKSGFGSTWSGGITAVTGFCTGVTVQNQAEFLNDAACSGATTATYAYTVATVGELANLKVTGDTANAVNAQVIVVNKNGTATALTCTIAIGAKTCTDTTHGVAVTVGDRIQFANTVGNTGAEAIYNISASLGLYGN